MIRGDIGANIDAASMGALAKLCSHFQNSLDEVEMSTTAPELIAACEARDRMRVGTLVSSIPSQAWTVIPGQAMVQLEMLRILVWHETGGSGINTYETMIVQVIVDEDDSKHFSYRFSADELQLPNYIPVADRRVVRPKAD